MPCLTDRATSHEFDAHYTYHPAWAARILARTRPESHVDIGGFLPFVVTVSAFVPMRFYDWRPLDLGLDNLDCAHADLLALPFEDNSLPSISCLHTVEHVGLGRYGDPVDVEGDSKAIRELQRVLAPGGDLLFVVPIGGTAKIAFNAHRIYSYDLVMISFRDFELCEFALIKEDASGMLFGDEARPEVKNQSYGCGCFWFKKPALKISRGNDERF